MESKERRAFRVQLTAALSHTLLTARPQCLTLSWSFQPRAGLPLSLLTVVLLKAMSTQGMWAHNKKTPQASHACFPHFPYQLPLPPEPLYFYPASGIKRLSLFYLKPFCSEIMALPLWAPRHSQSRRHIIFLIWQRTTSNVPDPSLHF